MTDERKQDAERTARHDEDDTPSTTDRDQPSAMGGEVATRSGTTPTPEEERSA